MELYRLLAIATQVDLRSKPFTGLPPLFFVAKRSVQGTGFNDLSLRLALAKSD
ncbi:hypothetical protein [Roseofilum capinflatum]|uniref:Transposase n=1 Tax=Roseofilum capinflatum BLCC-M114 TaxID=3022440 RepID=A0ABT7B8Y7_9CYAN|nr:hypothetical protein [Roseofilum capinflatum]MDJ1175630.1 hypothetical protein [Roseofilum capinflatum BLCC-M114]